MKRLLGLLVLACSLAAPAVHAEMIGTDKVVQSDRERVKAALERPEVVQALKKLGVDASAAEARVDAMSDTEVAQIAGLVDQLPAGGALSNEQLLAILLLVILLVLLL